MREIKFRAWDENEKCFIDGFSIHNTGLFTDLINAKIINGLAISDAHWRKQEDIPNIKIMQYTGLKDKNGREIYEGDIVKGVDFRLHAEYVSQVKWYEKGYWYAFNKYGKGIGFVNNIELLEVIGNIYENPELLEGI